MTAGDVFQRVCALWEDYSQEVGMGAERGPLRAVRQVAAGILWTGSVQLSNAARLVASTPEELGSVVDRLSDHLANPRWDHRPWSSGLLAHHLAAMEDLTLLALDGTDLAKPYARKMEYQDTVQDASAPGAPLVTGYWCFGAYLWDPDHQSLCPLMLQPYSTLQPGFRSENQVWLECLWALRRATEGKGIWVMDRGGDRPAILSAFLYVQPRWIIRLREDRALVGPDGTVRPAGAWADYALLTRPERGRAVTLPVSLPRQDVWQVPRPPALHLLVPTSTFGPQEERWVLLTCGLIGQHVGPRQVRHDYGFRWHSEDAKRLLGQVWHVERFLTRSFVALERMLACVVAAGGFLRTLRLEEPALTDLLESEVLYHTDTCRIPDYRLARGLQILAAQARHPSIANNA